MPLLFIGHGSPMNAIQTNEFTRTLNSLGASLPRPKAILCISAHWMTRGTWVTEMARPRTIHDFYGFPEALFDVQYPAPGSPETAALVRNTVVEPPVQGDSSEWGLDHGTWSVLRHLYPLADVPVLQLSVDMTQPGPGHLALGERLKPLREQGILIVGSGNVVHNLRKIVWDEGAPAHAWAEEFDDRVKRELQSRDYRFLAGEALETEAGKLSHPTPDHYFPLLPILGASDLRDELRFEFEGIELGSISMRALSLGSVA